MSETIHATSVAIAGEGVLLTGLSGSGKSDLAVRLIHEGASLIADDRVILTPSNGQLLLSAPDNLAGVIELHGIGLIRMAHQATAPLKLVIECTPTSERLPARRHWAHSDIAIDKIALNPFHASAPARIACYLAALRSGQVLPEDWFAHSGHSKPSESRS